MTTEAAIGYGTLFAINDGNSPEGFVTVAEVTNVTPPGLSRDAIDASHEQSPDSYREFIAGMIDGGEVSIELNFVPGSNTTALLLDEIEKRTLREYRITFPDGSTWVFDGFKTGFEPEAPLDDKMVASATFKVSGKPVLTQA